MRFIFPYIFIALSIAMFFFLARPIYADIVKLRTDVASYNVALSHSTDLQKVRDGLASKYSNISAMDKNRLSRFLPDTVDNIQLILELEEMASAHGISIKNITFTTPQTDDKNSSAKTSSYYGIFNLDFKTQANYETFVLFLKDIERNLRLIDVKNISFTVNTNARTATTTFDPLVYEYNVKIQTYWLK